MKSHHHQCPTRMGVSAFTLIEILVVIGIIAVLFVLVLGPGLKAVRNKANAAQCMSNLRQIGAAFQVFATEHNGEYPAVTGDPDADNKDALNGKGSQWDVQLLPYLEMRANKTKTPMKKTVYYCPASVADPSYANSAATLLSYTYNRNLGIEKTKLDTTRGMRTALIENASTLLLLADVELQASTSDISYVPKSGQGKNNTIVTGGSGNLAARHNKAINILFLDGHVSPRRRLRDNDKTSDPENIRWTPDGELTPSR